MNKIYVYEELNKFTKMIENGENFAFLRYGEQEFALFEETNSNNDYTEYSLNKVDSLRTAITDSISLLEPNVYYAIPCPQCNSREYYWYISRIANPVNATFESLWNNTKEFNFRDWISTINRECVIISNIEEEGFKSIGFNVLKYYKIQDNYVEYWNDYSGSLLSSIKKEYGNRNNLLYVIAAGPLSGPIIADLFRFNPQNCYIDFGSIVSNIINNKSKITQKRRRDKNEICCWMYNPKEISFDVTCVCNLYKRPESLIKQLEALEHQTLKPKSIILYQDGISGSKYDITFSESLLSSFECYRRANSNTGVWPRFQFAKDVVKTKYTCVFDDDTIPGERWLENCMTEMIAHDDEGIYGTNGIMLTDDHSYPQGGYYPVGWKNPIKKCVQVDFVGHSWFLKTKYLDYMFDNTEKYQKLKYVAEDMCISVKANEHGIKTYVPPHPANDTSFWGSSPLLGYAFGFAVEALSISQNNLTLMQKAISMFKEDGWKPICIEKPRMVTKTRINTRTEKIKRYYLKVKETIKGRLCIK